MTRSPALTSSARAAAVATSAARPAQAIEISVIFLMFIGLLLIIRKTSGSFHEMDGGMQRAEHPDDGKDRKRKRDLDERVAPQRGKRGRAGAVLRADGKLRREREPVDGGKADHDRKGSELEQEKPAVIGRKQRTDRAD